MRQDTNRHFELITLRSLQFLRISENAEIVNSFWNSDLPISTSVAPREHPFLLHSLANVSYQEVIIIQHYPVSCSCGNQCEHGSFQAVHHRVRSRQFCPARVGQVHSEHKSFLNG